MYHHQGKPFVMIFAVRAPHFSTPVGFTFMHLCKRAFQGSQTLIVKKIKSVAVYCFITTKNCGIFSSLVEQASSLCGRHIFLYALLRDDHTLVPLFLLSQPGRECRIFILPAHGTFSLNSFVS